MKPNPEQLSGMTKRDRQMMELPTDRESQNKKRPGDVLGVSEIKSDRAVHAEAQAERLKKFEALKPQLEALAANGPRTLEGLKPEIAMLQGLDLENLKTSSSQRIKSGIAEVKMFEHRVNDAKQMLEIINSGEAGIRLNQDPALLSIASGAFERGPDLIVREIKSLVSEIPKFQKEAIDNAELARQRKAKIREAVEKGAPIKHSSRRGRGGAGIVASKQEVDAAMREIENERQLRRETGL